MSKNIFGKLNQSVAIAVMGLVTSFSSAPSSREDEGMEQKLLENYRDYADRCAILVGSGALRRL